MRYGSLCSGIEAASAAWGPLGWEAAWFSEIEKFPCAVLAARYPDVPNLGDMTKILEVLNSEQRNIDVLVGGTPCFPGGTLVATKEALKPIALIKPGDFVLTHTGSYKRVLRTGSKVSSTIKLHGQGQSAGLETTRNHPFYSRQKNRVWVGRKKGSYATEMSERQWTPAEDMAGQFWASPVKWPASNVPKIKAVGRESNIPEITPTLLRVVGRWLGDGWTRINNRRGYVLICCGKHEVEAVKEELRAASVHFSSSEERTTFRFQIASRPFARWLSTHFGSGAHRKTMPTWVFGMCKDYRRELLRGYVEADGHITKKNNYRITTVSKSLALATVLLAHSLGYSTTRIYVVPKRETCVIEGRTVKEGGFFQITLYLNGGRSSSEDGLHRWGLVRKQSEASTATEVFNLEVEGDHSYVADGIVVHNCQAFSVAGLRGSLSDERGNLTLEFVRIADDLEPPCILWENVPGVLNTKDNAFGCFLGAMAGEDGALEPPGGRWTNAGYVLGPKRTVAWRIFDAQYFGVAQRRRRVFVVACPRDGADPRAILFESEGLRWNTAPSREAGESITHDTAPSLRGSGPGVERVGDSRGQDPVVATLDASYGRLQGCSGQDANHRHSHLVAYGGNRTSGPIEVSPALNAAPGGGRRMDFESEALLVNTGPELYSIMPMNSGKEYKARKVSVAQPLMSGVVGGNQGGDYVLSATGTIAFDTTQITSPANRSVPKVDDPCHPLAAGAHVLTVAFMPGQGAKAGSIAASEHISPTLRSADSGTNRVPAVCFNAREDTCVTGDRAGALGSSSPQAQAICGSPSDFGLQDGERQMELGFGMQVRRLTEVECERLQGFEDFWTDIPYGRPKFPDQQCPSGHRYKALGNSFAVPVVHWIGKRIEAIIKK